MTTAAAPLDTADLPLCIDLDGTLTRADTLWRSVLALARARPLSLARLPSWLLSGKARLKQQVAARARLDPSRLPYNAGLLRWLHAERRAGRTIWLVTAADRRTAEAIAAYVGVFSGVLASDGARNLKGREKAARLRELFPGGFDYAGNAAADLAVWRWARHAIVVNASRRLIRRARAQARVVRVIPRTENVSHSSIPSRLAAIARRRFAPPQPPREPHSPR